MTLKTTPFDAARHLRTPEIVAAYLNEALDDGDPELIARALDTIARARDVSGDADRSSSGRDATVVTSDLETVRRSLNALGLRLQVAAA